MLPKGIRQEDFLPFAETLFDHEEHARKAAPILKGILNAGSLRLSDVSHTMPGSPDAGHKAIQRFLQEVDPREVLLRLFDEKAPFFLADPTEIQRKQARKTEYVSRLSDGKTRGFFLLTAAQPYKGRAIPFAFITYSEGMLNRETTSRNLEHQRAFRRVKELIGEKPLVLDREFSSERLFQAMVAEGVNFVVRLNTGNRPTITDEEGNKLSLSLRPGEGVFKRGVYDKGRVRGNLAGEWREGFAEPLWVFSLLEPEEALGVYRGRMKIEEGFRDLKSLLGLGRVMNERREQMEKMVALVFLVYAVGLLVGEVLRERLYRGEKAEALLGSLHPVEA